MPLRHLIPVLLVFGGLAAEEGTVPAPAVAVEGVAPVAAPAGDELTHGISYLMGRDVGGRVKGAIVEYGMDTERLMEGLRDAITGKPSSIPPEAAEALMQAFQAREQGKAAEREKLAAATAGKRLEDNAAYLAENAKKEGITVLPSGLQYEVLAKGEASGESPHQGDKVKVSYAGTLLDGTVFDASARHGGPAVFTVGQLIAGWNEALTLMKPGDKWRLTIPSELAYGPKGPETIGDDQVLVFELELHEVMH